MHIRVGTHNTPNSIVHIPAQDHTLKLDLVSLKLLTLLAGSSFSTLPNPGGYRYDFHDSRAFGIKPASLCVAAPSLGF